MKTKLLFLALLSTITFYSQTQIGTDIEGEELEDRFGSSVSLSSDGSIVAIGAFSGTGYVRVYENSGGTWNQIGQVIEGEAIGDNSGYSVSLSSNGNIVAIGAPGNDDNGSSSGQVRVYENISGVWTQIGQDINGEAQGDYSGRSLSLSSDGNIVAIGAEQNDGNGTGSGQVRVYQNLSSVWTQIGNDIDGEAALDKSGSSVSLSSNGNIVAIGALGNDDNGSSSGQVRVYENISGVWTQIGEDFNGEAYDNQLGTSVSLSSNGDVLAIGAPRNDYNGSNSGQVRIYQNNSNVWTQIGNDINGEGESNFAGFNISLSSDGSIVAIGSPYNSDNGSYSGQVRIYKNISDVWTQIGNDINGEAASDQSGISVSLSADGSIVAIGADKNDGNGEDSGHVRIYDLSALLSLEDNEINKNLIVYPNPVNDYLHLQLSTTLEFKKATIYNYFGQLVLETKTTIIDVGNLSSGIYFLKVETNNGKGVKKFIKK